MKFNSTFDGSLGIKSLLPLKFRNKCTIWFKRVQKIKGFNESHAVLVLIHSLTGIAEQLITREREQDIETFNDFIEWFDETFKITTIRSELAKQIKNFQLHPAIPRLKIMEEFNALLSLFKLSGDFATTTLKLHTQFTEETLLQIIISQFKSYDKKFYREWDKQTSINGGIPKTLQELKELIIKINEIMIEKEVVEQLNNNNINNNNNNKNISNINNTYTPFDADPITNIGSINAINNINNGYYNQTNNPYNNSYNNNNNNNNNYYGSFTNRGTGNNRFQPRRGGRGRRGGRYGRGGNRDRSYNNNYRGGYNRGNYGRSRGRNNNNRSRYGYNNNNFDNRQYFWPKGNPKYFRPIEYITKECRTCNKWGHREFYCKFMNSCFPNITANYDKLRVVNNSTINNINSQSKQKQNKINKNKQINNNNIDDSSSDSDNNNNNNNNNIGTFPSYSSYGSYINNQQQQQP